MRDRLRYPLLGAVLATATALATFACAALLGDDPVVSATPDGAVDASTEAAQPACDAEVASDIDNCGSCGRSCRDSMDSGFCKSGACQAIPFAEPGNVGLLTASAGVVAWADDRILRGCKSSDVVCDAGPPLFDAGQKIKSLASSGRFVVIATAAQVVTCDGPTDSSCQTLLTGAAAKDQLAVDDNDTFVATASGILGCPRDAGCVTFASNTGTISQLALSSSHVIWNKSGAILASDRCAACDAGGREAGVGVPYTIYSGHAVTGLAALRDNVYFINMSSPAVFVCPADGGCGKLEDGGAPRIATLKSNPKALVAEGSQIVWLHADGDIMGCNLGNCTTPVVLGRVAGGTQLIALSNEHIYVYLPSPSPGTIGRIVR